MGYRANPYATTLMTNIRSGRLPKDQGCLALVSDFASQERMLSHDVFRTWWEHLKRRAYLLGYRIEMFLTGAPGMNGKKINRILTERGIRSIIIGNCSKNFFPANRDVFDWNRDVCATPRDDFNIYGIDCVCTDCYHNAVLAFRQTLDRGYSRNRPCGSDFSGVDENNERVGETLCDTVVNRLTHNECGFPEHSLTVHIKGTWREGRSLPEKKPARRKK
ncbi:MAG: hypothetical protein WC661_19200 [Opitutaceae bacterium]|jgi:LacI family transcriptional regulator